MNSAALAAACALCLTFGLGDVADESLLAGLRLVQWTAIGLAVLAAVYRGAWLPRHVALPLLAWLGVLMLSALAAPTHRAEALATLTRPLSGALLCWMAYAVTPTRMRWQVLCVALALGGLGTGLVGLAEVVGVEPVANLLTAVHDTQLPVADVPRLTATLSHPNVAAVVLELTLPLLVAASFSAPSSWRPLALLLLVAQLGALSLTFSRAGILAGAAALAVLALIAARRGARAVLAPVALAAVAGPLGVVLAGGMLPQVERRLVAEVEQTGYRATYTTPDVVEAGPQQVLDVLVRVTNAGSSGWSAMDDSRVALGYHLLRPDGTPLEFDCPATLLPADVPPHASLDMLVRLRAPAVAGSYLVEWDALREGVAWFSWRGSPTASMNLLVAPNGPGVSLATDSAVVAFPRPARVQFWAAAWGMLRDQPWLGVGPDNFRLRFVEYSGIPESHIGTHAHSMYLESLADTGVLGFLALSSLLLALVRLAHRDLGSSADRDWLWRAALLASLTAWLVHAVLDDLERFLPAHIALWVIVGLTVRGSQLVQRAHRAE